MANTKAEAPIQNWIPIIDAGHGGLDEKGVYHTEGKRYKFTGKDVRDLEIFEGEINRKIAKSLIFKLNSYGIKYVDLNSNIPIDIPLEDRVKTINSFYLKDKRHYLISIHCNSVSTTLEGPGTEAHGFEIFTYPGAQRANQFAEIAASEYNNSFPEIPFRGIKDAKFYLLSHTLCPALLTENLFIDNYDDAQFLISPNGQDAIAECLLNTIQQISKLDGPTQETRDSSKFKEKPASKKVDPKVTPPPPKPKETPWIEIKSDISSDKTITKDKDQLGYRNYSSAISTIIKENIKGKPFNIGIIAPWGHGKTTLMEFIREDLEPESTNDKPHFSKEFYTSIKDLRDWLKIDNSQKEGFESFKNFHPTIWFNAWKYQSSNQIWAGIGHAIINQLVEKLSPREQEKFWFRLKNKTIDKQGIQKKLFKYIYQNLPSTILSALLSLLIVYGIYLLSITQINEVVGSMITALGLGGGIWSFSNIKKIYAKLKQPVEGVLSEPVTAPDYSDNLGMYHQLTEDLQRVFEILISPEKPAVVFIDDLDRCSPDVVAEVIEAINLIMTSPSIGSNCFFIFGMDAQVVAATLDEKYKNLEGKLPGQEHTYGSVGWYFLDKFIQLPFIIPVLKQDDKKKFLSEFFTSKTDEEQKKIDTKVITEKVSRLKKAMQEGNKQDISDIINEAEEPIAKQELEQTFIAEKIKTTQDDSPEISEQIEYMSKYLSSSPREIKRYINLLRFHNVHQELRQHKGQEIPEFKETAKWLLISLKWPQLVRWIQWENEQELVLANIPEVKAKKIDEIVNSFLKQNKELNLDDPAILVSWRNHIKKKKAEKLEWLNDKQLFFVLTDSNGKEGSFEKAINCRVW